MFSRTNGAGWALNEKLTAAQINSLDIDHAKAVDGTGGGAYTPSAKVDIQGEGLSAGKFYENVRSINAAYVLDASGSDVCLLVDAGVFGVGITLPAAADGRIVFIKKTAGAGTVVITPNGAESIEGLATFYRLLQIGSSVTLVGKAGTGWTIVDRGRNETSQTFTATAASAWTAPGGCYWVDIEGCGGGGGGSGGTAANTATGSGTGGGPGGGGAPLIRRRVAVVPGTAYDVNIGAGGAGGPQNTSGSPGGSTTLVAHGGATLATLPGGNGGSKPVGISVGESSAPGGIVNGGTFVQGTSWDDYPHAAVPGQGGFAGNNISGTQSTGGSYSLNFVAGGNPGAMGGVSGLYNGGGGGGGGGGGPYGVGADGKDGGAGSATNGGNGNPGLSAAANSGGGGGGAGGGGFGGTSGGSGGVGGAGGSGQLTIYWVE